LWYYLYNKVKITVVSALSIKGQATIPKAIRDYLHLSPGDRVKFFIHPEGTVVILPKIPASKLKGILETTRTASLDEMEKAPLEGAASQMRRAHRR
jgi:AbrB family looped-hinge helix DNA binding protein